MSVEARSDDVHVLFLDRSFEISIEFFELWKLFKINIIKFFQWMDVYLVLLINNFLIDPHNLIIILSIIRSLFTLWSYVFNIFQLVFSQLILLKLRIKNYIALHWRLILFYYRCYILTVRKILLWLIFSYGDIRWIHHLWCAFHLFMFIIY